MALFLENKARFRKIDSGLGKLYPTTAKFGPSSQKFGHHFKRSEPILENFADVRTGIGNIIYEIAQPAQLQIWR